MAPAEVRTLLTVLATSPALVLGVDPCATATLVLSDTCLQDDVNELTFPGDVSAQTCSEAYADGMAKTRAQYAVELADGCCADGLSICTEYLMNPCETKANYNASASAMQGLSCGNTMASFLDFEANQANCDADGPIMDSNGVLMSRKASLAMIAQYCCTDKVPACSGSITDPCGTTGNFNIGSTTLQGDSCGFTMASFPVFDANQDNCDADGPITDLNGVLMSRAASLGKIAQDCCTDLKSMCEAYVVNPCNVADKFNAAAQITGGLSCGGQAAMIPSPFTKSAENCAVAATTDGRIVQALMGDMATECCQGEATACQEYTMNPCKDPDEYDPLAQFDPSTTCKVIVSRWAAFTPSVADCEVVIAQLGNKSRTTILDEAAAQCCKGGASACATEEENSVGSTPGAELPSVLLGALALGTLGL